MENNKILRQLRYTFDFSDGKMANLFALGQLECSKKQIENWLKKEEELGFEVLTDRQLAVFLNGFIVHNRGKKEGPQPQPEDRLNNNLILRKLKIALNLKDTDMLEILDLADFKLGKHELSAFFRKSSQDQYRECKDQVLRNFLFGLQLRYRK